MGGRRCCRLMFCELFSFVRLDGRGCVGLAMGVALFNDDV
jgi:hypothetical protein